MYIEKSQNFFKRQIQEVLKCTQDSVANLVRPGKCKLKLLFCFLNQNEFVNAILSLTFWSCIIYSYMLSRAIFW